MIIIDPIKRSEIENKWRIDAIKQELDLIDQKSIRPLRDNETDKLIELENQANILRAELRGLI